MIRSSKVTGEKPAAQSKCFLENSIRSARGMNPGEGSDQTKTMRQSTLNSARGGKKSKSQSLTELPDMMRFIVIIIVLFYILTKKNYIKMKKKHAQSYSQLKLPDKVDKG